MNKANPTASSGKLRTVDVSSQLFLSSKRACGEQLQLTHQGIGTLYVGGGIFTRPEQNVNTTQTQRPSPTQKELNK
jgi:hypothetical protein